jgi:uridylate kinase
LEKGRIVIFAAGTGNPFFTTDTAATLRATEIKAEIILKGTKVDGVYDYDPVTNENAVMYKALTHHEVVQKSLRVMDTTAVTLSKDNNIPIRVFNLNVKSNLKRIIQGEDIGTYISSD